MTFEPKMSRFAVLPDDVPEPIAKSSGDKPRKKKPADQKAKVGPVGDAAKKKGSAAKGKSLRSLAFGSASENGKKKAMIPPAPQPKPLVNGAKKTSAQWEDWQRRDTDLVDEEYETDLEAALFQSQLDFQKELSRQESEKAAAKSSKVKKKGITVPLTEFNALLLNNPKQDAAKQLANPYADEPDEELIESYRNQARLQLEREKQREQQRDASTKRTSSEGHPHSKERARESEYDEQNRTIENLRAENELLKSELENSNRELESYKARLKKVHEIFQGAQELKDKAKIIFQVETLTKFQEDLQEQIQVLHSQLEQERSKSHAAINEQRRLMEQSRRRTNTEVSA
ncbi:G kinase-anchoring protein 1 [Folsomia candida]|uniref:G kinase-anchoring protein 1 n=1 Tax=Folsomia candida TaxID=158441 RepID=A0A226EY65_FOLCA|nr:G kinase-anchoring protein 1 [Folsomia candida]